MQNDWEKEYSSLWKPDGGSYDRIKSFIATLLAEKEQECAMLVEDCHDFHKPADSEWNMAIKKASHRLFHDRFGRKK